MSDYDTETIDAWVEYFKLLAETDKQTKTTENSEAS